MIEGFNVAYLWCGKGSLAFAPGSNFEEVQYSDAYDFMWIRHGKVTFEIQRKTYQAGPGTVILVQPFQTFAWTADPLEPATGRFCRFGLSSIPSDWPDPKLWTAKRELPADDIIRPLLQYVSGHGLIAGGSYPNSQSAVPPAIEMAIRTVLAAFVLGPVDRSHVLARTYPQPVQDVLHWMRELMDSYPGRKVSLDDLASVGGISSRHLCHLFQEHLGYAPLEVLYMYRVARSLTGLRSGQKIETLARELGFAHAAHFARRFRGVFGKSPTQMQNSLAKGIFPKLPRLPFL